MVVAVVVGDRLHVTCDMLHMTGFCCCCFFLIFSYFCSIVICIGTSTQLEIQCLKYAVLFLAALSSSRSLIVGPLVCWSVGLLVRLTPL